MTFQEIVAEVAARLNLTSPDAMARIGREVNARHRRVTSAVGLDISRRVLDVVGVGVLGESTVTFTGLAKIERVFDTRNGTIKILNEITFDEMRATALRPDDSPSLYAIQTMTASSIVVALNAVIKTVYDLKADGLASSTVLSGTMVPSLPDDFHDILIEGTCADELRKMEKLTDAKTAEALAEYRLSELRLFIAKSAYLSRKQGGRAGGRSGAGGSRQTEGGGGGVPGDLDIHQTGLITFDRDPNAPFAVTPGSAPVANLIAEKALYIADVATDRLIGRDTPGTGNSEQLTVGGGLEFTGTLGLQRSALTGDVTAAAGSGVTTLTPNTVTSTALADGAVTTPKLADGAVTAVKIGDGQITNAKLAPDAITADKIADLSVSTADLADLSVTTPKLADGAVATGKIGDAQVTAPKLAPNAVTTPAILDLNVTTPKLADGAVTTPKLADGAVTGPKLASGSISFAALPDIAANRLLGRGGSVGVGDPEEIALGAGLAMSGTTLTVVTGGAADAIQNVEADRLIGRDTAGIGNSEQLIVTEGLAFTGVGGIGIANNGVTFAKLQDVSGPSRLLGRGAAGAAGDPEEITLGTGLSMTGTVLNGLSGVPLAHHTSHEPGGADALVNVAWTNLANVFTANQTISKAEPRLVLDFLGSTTKSRLFAAVPDWIGMTVNTYYVGGSGWLRDDPAKIGMGSYLGTDMFEVFRIDTAGVFNAVFRVAVTTGLVTVPGALQVSGNATVSGTGGNVALKTIDNQFVPQTFPDGCYIRGNNSWSVWWATGAPLDARVWRWINYGGEGALRLEALNDGFTVAQGAFYFYRNSVFLAQGGLGATPLNASQITTGTVPDARLSTNVALKNIDNQFVVAQTLASGSAIAGGNALLYFRATVSPADKKQWRFTHYGTSDGFLYLEPLTDAGGVQSSGITFFRDGSAQFAGGLNATPLNASLLTAGSIPDARLSTNVALKNINNNFSAFQQLPDQSQIIGNNGWLWLNALSAPAGLKLWRFLNYGDGSLQIEAFADDATTFQGRVSITRAGGLVPANGVHYPAGGAGLSASPNCLDAYQEGLWTPVLESTNGFSGLTYHWAQGQYVKIGVLVTLFFDIYVATPGTATGTLLIGGFPFRGHPNYYTNGVVSLMANNLLGAFSGVWGTVGPHAWNMEIWVLPPNTGAVTAMTPAYIGAYSRFQGSLSYRAES